MTCLFKQFKHKFNHIYWVSNAPKKYFMIFYVKTTRLNPQLIKLSKTTKQAWTNEPTTGLNTQVIEPIKTTKEALTNVVASPLASLQITIANSSVWQLVCHLQALLQSALE